MKHSVRKKLLAAAGVAAAVAALCAGAFFWYVSDYYRAEDVALEVMARGTGITVEGEFTILSPSVPSDTGIVFYPGAKVEAEAYLPLLDRIRQTGVTCVLWCTCPSTWPSLTPARPRMCSPCSRR